MFGVVDGLTTPLYDRILGIRVPGLGVASTAVALVLVGALALTGLTWALILLRNFA